MDGIFGIVYGNGGKRCDGYYGILPLCFDCQKERKDNSGYARYAYYYP